MKKLFSIIAVLFAGFTRAVSLSDGTVEEPFSMLKPQVQFPRSAGTAFKIGGLFSITNAGVNTSISDKGLQRAEAMKLAIDLVNQDPNLLPNVTLKYDIQDDG